MIEAAQVLTWLGARLRADATLCALLPDGAAGIAREGIPGVQSSHLPIVVYSATPLQDVLNLMGNYRVIVPGLYTVKVIGRRDQYAAAIVPAANRLDTLLDRVSGSSGGVQVRSCIRQQILAYAEDDPALGWIEYLGGQWYIEAQ